jgi:hypothetical protein
MRPWLEGKHLYESLKDGTLGLEDIALMNDVLDAAAYNVERRMANDADERRFNTRRTS